MKLRFTEKADKDYAGLPAAIRKALGKQLRFLLVNRGHPSLRAKNYMKRAMNMSFSSSPRGDQFASAELSAVPPGYAAS